jgi:hypothetical protein
MQPTLFEMAMPPGRNSTNFVDNMSQPVHRWFRYSAGFSADWVRDVLADCGNDMAIRVLDPFAGSATTLLAAQSSQVASLGLDSHPFVARIAKAKLNWTADYQELRSRGKALVDFDSQPLPNKLPPLLTKCYTPTVLADLLSLRDQLSKCRQGDAIDELLWLAFVGIVRSVSFAGTAQWQYVLPNKRKSTVAGVREAFSQRVRLMTADMEWRQTACPAPRAATEYHQADARALDSYPANWATHVICSPPYANNYDYADATRLEQTVLGEVSSWGDLKGTRQRLIRSCSQHMGGYNALEALDDPILEPIVTELRPVYSELSTVKGEHGGKKAYDLMILAYFHDLAFVWRALRKATTPGSKVCFVIGDSAPYGVYVPVEQWLGELALSAGFRAWRFEKVRDRNVKWENRKHRVPLHEGRLWVDG